MQTLQPIDAGRVYTEHEAIIELRISFAQLERARKGGSLPFRERRRGQREYEGRHLAAWLEGETR